MNSRVLTGQELKDCRVTYFRGAAQHTISQSVDDESQYPDSHDGSSAHETFMFAFCLCRGIAICSRHLKKQCSRKRRDFPKLQGLNKSLRFWKVPAVLESPCGFESTTDPAMQSFRPKRRNSFKTAVNKISKQLFKELESSKDESDSSPFPGGNFVDHKSKSQKTHGDVRLCEHEFDDEEDVLCELIDYDHVDGNFKAFVCMNSRILTRKEFKDCSVTYFRGAAQHTIGQSAVDGEDPDSHDGSRMKVICLSPGREILMHVPSSAQLVGRSSSPQI